jgi:5-hydroxyisourate hydrolase
MGISTHILDTAIGRPAVRVGVVLSMEREGAWVELFRGETDADGRCKPLPGEAQRLEVATYRIEFATADYYRSQRVEGLYPVVEITFSVTNDLQHYHIPLLLTANGYTTYRGS